MSLDKKFHAISTLIEVSAQKRKFTGTGFFYHELEDKSQNSSQHKITNAWLVTNRHVILPGIDKQEFFPDSFSFNLRKQINGQVVWDTVKFDKDELLKRARFHPDGDVDVGIIQIFDILKDKKRDKQHVVGFSVHKDNLPGGKDQQITMEVTDDVSVIGYPHGFYDEFNMFPIVKSGTIATRWGAHFNRHPYFLIDAKLFPGSSGSIVVSKPKDVMAKEGQILTSKEKNFAFLGIFSGEPFYEQAPIESDELTIILKSKFNVGIVWYGYLVEEIIKNGVSFSP